MPEIKKSVGDGGQNNQDDVALIQAMLVVVKNAKNAPYLGSYDGVAGKDTRAAIVAFQKDHVFKPQAGFMDAGAGLKAAVPDAANGKINPNDATFKQLVSMLPADYKEINVLPGGKTVYIAATDADVKASSEDVKGEIGLEGNFRAKVAQLIEAVYKQHKIAPWVIPNKHFGRRRTFQSQYELTLALQNGKPVTNAGPGESNHNYGQAVDIGFSGLRWLKSDGTIVKNEQHWLNLLEAKKAAEALRFWKALQDIGTGTVGLFRGPAADQPHLQTWNDQVVSMGQRLSALLTAGGTMKWTAQHAGKNNHYSTDFGLGGKFYDVGIAKEIWNNNATVTKDMVATTKTEAAKKAAVLKGPNSDEWKNFKPVSPAQIKNEDLTTAKAQLKAEFEAAEKNWKKWTPF